MAPLFTFNPDGGTDGNTVSISDAGVGTAPSEILGPTADGFIKYSNVAIPPRFGSVSVRAATRTTVGANGMGFIIGTAQASGNHNFYWMVSVSNASSINLISTRNGTGNIGFIVLTATNNLRISSASGTAVFTGTAKWTPNQWYRLEWLCTAGGATATMRYWWYDAFTESLIEDSGNQTVTPGASQTVYDTFRIGQLTAGTANLPGSGSTDFLYLHKVKGFDSAQIGPEVPIAPLPLMRTGIMTGSRF